MSLLGDLNDARDVLKETKLVLCRKTDQYGEMRDIGAWTRSPTASDAPLNGLVHGFATYRQLYQHFSDQFKFPPPMSFFEKMTPRQPG
ncbi:MAG: hypothetical protein RLZZ245_4027 [Verrucomicrobiota bacterium]